VQHADIPRAGDSNVHRAGAVRLAVLLLLAVTLAGRLWVALADYRLLIGADIWQDDAFYYLKIAQNILGGRGVTFDGQTTTNGFHPLFMALAVAVMSAVRDDPARAVRLLSQLSAIVAVATGALVFVLQRRLSGPLTALCALALWALSPYFTVFGVNGQETGLAILFTVLLILLYQRLIALDGAAGWGDYLWAGAAGGLAILARLDLAILVVALSADWLCKAALRQVPAGQGKKVAAAGLVILAVTLPWGAAGRGLTGNALPLSGAASRQIALEFGWTDLQHTWSSAADTAPAAFAGHPPAVFYADVATKLLGIFALEYPLSAPLRLNVPFTVWPRLQNYALFAWAPYLPASLAALALLALLKLALTAKPAVGKTPRGQNLHVLFGAYLLLFFAGYVFYSPAHWCFSRYLAAPVLVATIWGLQLGRALLSGSGAPQLGARRGALALVLILAASQAYLAWTWLDQFAAARRNSSFLTSWERLGPAIEPSATIGSFQSGIIGFFSGRDVVNLDGKVNPEAYEAIRTRRLHEYIRRKNITYIIDWDWISYLLCLRYAPPGAIHLEKVGQEPDGARMSLWRVR